MEPEAERLQQEIEALLSRADYADTVDDNQFGDLSGDEIPEGLNTPLGASTYRQRRKLLPRL